MFVPHLRRIAAALVSLSALFGLASFPVAAQSAKAASVSEPVLMLSDIHFDPFRDPGKAAQLAAAPVFSWRAILDAPASPDSEERLAALEKSCHTRGRDTDEALLASSLRAIATQAHGARFVTVTGDLLAHAFDCKYEALFPHAQPASYRQFTVKTMEYVLHELRRALPNVPVYAALGNNDSGCGDYKLDPRSEFLAESAPAFVADLPASERAQARSDFAAFGDYSVTLPAPFRHTRILALDDLFESKHYAGCAAAERASKTAPPDTAPAREQLAWLARQLQAARTKGEKVWIIGHIPPGIDPFSTATHLRNVCSGQPPEFFLSSTALANTIAPFGDVVPLALFAHTHMDEMRLIPPTHGSHKPVPIKMVPSISPINGNLPSFTLARIDLATATLADYRVIASSDRTGSSWAQSYDFRESYGLPGFTSTTAAQLIAGFLADPQAGQPTSKAYIRNYYVRDASLLLTGYWPQYACALASMDEATYRACRCPASH